jgi:hypothetical protein
MTTESSVQAFPGPSRSTVRPQTASDEFGGGIPAPTSPGRLTGRTRPRSPWATPWWAWLVVAAALAAIVTGAALTP